MRRRLLLRPVGPLLANLGPLCTCSSRCVAEGNFLALSTHRRLTLFPPSPTLAVAVQQITSCETVSRDGEVYLPTEDKGEDQRLASRAKQQEEALMKSIESAQPNRLKRNASTPLTPNKALVQLRHSKRPLQSAFWPVNRYNFIRAIGAKG